MGETGPLYLDSGGKSTYAALQSAYAGLQPSGSTDRVLVDSSCVLYAQNSANYTDAQQYWYGSYGLMVQDNNALRQGFYLQIAFLIAQNATMYQGIQMPTGFPIFALIYEGARQLWRWGSDDALWLAKRDLLGMGLFNRTGGPGAPYSSDQSVADMIGNDFILIIVSFVSGRDWRPYFDMRGVQFSDLARQQIEAHCVSGRVARTTMKDFPLVAIASTNAPQADVKAPVVQIDGYSSWPLDGFNPVSCTGVRSSKGYTLKPTPSPTRAPTQTGQIMVMYGSSVTGLVPIQATRVAASGVTVYMIYQDGYTKMVSELGQAKYYSGPISAFNPTSWDDAVAYRDVTGQYLLKYISAPTRSPSPAPTKVSMDMGA